MSKSQIDKCKLYSGVVFAKNKAHRKMRDKISAPSILILGCALQFQRSNNAERDFIRGNQLLKADEDWGRRAVNQIKSLRGGEYAEPVTLSPQMMALERSRPTDCLSGL
jgi:hypothetical protein